MSNGPGDWRDYALPDEAPEIACAERYLAKIRNRCVQRMRAAYAAKRKGKVRRPYQDLPRAEASNGR
jgi:hypothetical protein